MCSNAGTLKLLLALLTSLVIFLLPFAISGGSLLGVEGSASHEWTNDWQGCE